jgi:thiol-disulfide isomerase/thioredoxin
MLSKKILTCLSTLLVAGALALSAAKLPRPLVDVSLEMPLGQKNIRLIDTRGKIRVILLVSVGCDHCERAIGVFNKVAKEYKSKNVDFYGSTVNIASARELPPFLVKTKPVFPFGAMQPPQVQGLADFNSQEKPFVPIVLFVDKTNYVRYQFNGDGEFFTAQAGNGKLKGKSEVEQIESRLRATLDAMLK